MTSSTRPTVAVATCSKMSLPGPGIMLLSRPFFSLGRPNQSWRIPMLRVKLSQIFQSSWKKMPVSQKRKFLMLVSMRFVEGFTPMFVTARGSSIAKSWML